MAFRTINISSGLRSGEFESMLLEYRADPEAQKSKLLDFFFFNNINKSKKPVKVKDMAMSSGKFPALHGLFEAKDDEEDVWVPLGKCLTEHYEAAGMFEKHSFSFRPKKISVFRDEEKGKNIYFLSSVQ